jgi:hypothetical protein
MQLVSDISVLHSIVQNRQYSFGWHMDNAMTPQEIYTSRAFVSGGQKWHHLN